MRIAPASKATLQKAAWLYAPIIFVLCLFVPPRTGYLRLLMVAMLTASVLGWLWRLWPHRGLRMALLFCFGASLALLGLPERRDTHRPPRIVEAYIAALQSYEGTPYWWGGETHTGIDCSGLMRAALIDACVRDGLCRLDGQRLRHAAWLWLHDQSANDLGEHIAQLTRDAMPREAANLNSIDYTDLQPGTLAIAGNGLHILAYLGDHQWIQADPGAGNVIVERAPSTNFWFRGPVKLVTWSLLP